MLRSESRYEFMYGETEVYRKVAYVMTDERVLYHQRLVLPNWRLNVSCAKIFPRKVQFVAAVNRLQNPFLDLKEGWV